MAASDERENTKDIGDFHSGFVTLVGRPNVGKSTLMNRILGEKIAIVSPKPQTTRNRIVGVKHFENEGQIIFVDTPGIHKAQGSLNRLMVDYAYEAMKEADVVLFMIDGEKTDLKRGLMPADTAILEHLRSLNVPIFLIINKVDKVNKPDLLPFLATVSQLHNFAEIFPVSATKGSGIADLERTLLARMPQGPHYYPPDQLSDISLRFMASEIIREKVLIFTHKEVPYSVAVEIETFKEFDEGRKAHIDAAIILERESQKGIVIGQGGQMLTRIGSEAHKDMEAAFDMEVGLKLFVKVEKDWTEIPSQLRRFGYGS